MSLSSWLVSKENFNISEFFCHAHNNKSHTDILYSLIYVQISSTEKKKTCTQSDSTCAKQHWQMVRCDNTCTVVSGLAEDFLWEVSGRSCDDASLKLGGGPSFYSLTVCFRWRAGWPSSLWHTHMQVDTHTYAERGAKWMSDAPCV